MKCTNKALLLTSLFALASCGGDSTLETSAVSEATQGVSDSEIILGSHTDLSGPVAIWGVGSINGARMRFEEANEAGGVNGRQIKFVVEDTQYQIPRAIQAANKLINRDKVFAMVLALGTPTNNAVLTQQLKAGIPNMFPLTGARSMVEPYHDLKFAQRGIYYDEIRAGVKYFLEEMGKEKPCVIYQDTDYGQEILEGAEDQLKEMGQALVGVSAHKPTESEFTASIIRLRNAQCDVVFMGTIHRDTILILEAARKMKFDVVFVGNNAAYGQVIAEQESGSGEGYHAFVHMAKLYKEDGLSDKVERWWDRYEARFNVEPGIPAMEGYRAADLVVTALENAGPDLDKAGFLAATEAITDYQDIFGYQIQFGPGDHKGVSESLLSVVENGKWKTLATAISY
ncbi:MAG: ABC transporter substrate-binding protein [Gammaproteobacteria bacterium]|jgi:branched-chain amino acid transport system substrate-binding protein|nr:ABC transporter substrate-binding protein [Gammaproteobacteria bacterium]MBT5442548.1 ABC transporter substrate-binding protein [Gammaproteobacteria bacterium]MBT5790673.1 ABC transporter substrate-binding protein [Gammaproteobacteria bacterium]MBT7176519.1 ABC transporter substrate-binding protein [Gammaproteobacteria bacterium]MBT7529604.1 ABC transporter substrate-binding protein [Gammaproteobacteria bacterium]